MSNNTTHTSAVRISGVVAFYHPYGTAAQQAQTLDVVGGTGADLAAVIADARKVSARTYPDARVAPARVMEIDQQWDCAGNLVH